MTQDAKKPPLPPHVGLMLGVFAVSTASIFIKFAQQQGVDSIVIAAFRLGIATIVVSPIVVIKYRNELLRLSFREIGISLLSGAFLAVHFAAWIKSLEFTTVASSVVLVTTTPLWVGIFSPVILRERVSQSVKVGLLIALAGTLTIGISDVCVIDSQLSCPSLQQLFAGQAFWGDALAILGAWTAAGYVMIGRRIRANLSLIPYIFLVYGMAAVVLIIMMGASGAKAIGFSDPVLIWLVLLALIPQLIGHSSFNWALGYLPAAYVAITLLGEPIGSTVLAYFFLGEIPGMVKVIGAFLIFGGILLASRNTSSDEQNNG